MTLLSMNEVTTFRWTLEEDVENYRAAGYTGIGVWRHKLQDEDEDRAVEQLVSSGLKVTNLSWAGGFTGSDGRTHDENVADAQDAIRTAASINAGCLVVYSGGRNNHTFRHAGRLLRMALDELLPLAETADVTLAIEPMHAACAKDWTFLTDLASTMTLLEEYGSPNLKIAYDTYHFPIHGRQRDVLKQIAPHLAIVYLSDRRQKPTIEQERRPLGLGRLQLGDVIWTLQEAGYAGDYDVKLLGSEIEEYDYWTLLEQSQLTFDELAPVASQRSRMIKPTTLRINSQLEIPRREIQFSFVRSSGPGGQNVNKVASKAILRWSPAQCSALPQNVLARLLSQCARRLNDRGELVLNSQRYRDQAKNIDDCLDKLRSLILAAATIPKKRKKTRVPKSVREGRLQEKRVTSEKKSRRRHTKFDD